MPYNTCQRSAVTSAYVFHFGQDRYSKLAKRDLRYRFYTKMEFEFDPDKSQKNKKKHGIDFVEAQLLWKDPNSIGFPARSEDEDRFALLARHNRKFWVAFYTLRADRVRLISVRRARIGEKKVYES